MADIIKQVEGLAKAGVSKDNEILLAGIRAMLRDFGWVRDVASAKSEVAKVEVKLKTLVLANMPGMIAGSILGFLIEHLVKF